MNSNAAFKLTCSPVDASSSSPRAESLSPVYGPIVSRRFGSTLGINLLGSTNKICSMNCSYCDLGLTEIRLNKTKLNAMYPTIAELEEAFAKSFIAARDHSTKIDTILISGNGEPTLYPQLSEAIDLLIQFRNTLLPKAKIVILTNGVGLDSRRVSEPLQKLDERVLKLDAGNESLFQAMNSPLTRVSLSTILTNSGKLKTPIVQAMFVRGTIDNTIPTDIDDWIEAIGLVRPKLVHIQTINRNPAVSGLIPVDEDSLYLIAHRLERRTHIKSLILA